MRSFRRLGYDLKLAVLSARRHALLTTLMICAAAAGVGAVTMTVALYHARSGNPMAGKGDHLFAVALDVRSKDPQQSESEEEARTPPSQLTYRDARALYASDIAKRRVMMFRSRLVAVPQGAEASPFMASVRVTTADFFSMFDVPFQYGSGWAAQADEGPGPEVVLSRRTNEKLFAGANSVGKTVSLGGRDYRVVGVLGDWAPLPKFYDLNGQAFDLPEDVFLPFGWTEALQLRSAGSVRCMGRAKLTSFQDLLNADCVWLQFWAELPDMQQRDRYQTFVDNYVTDQKKAGRFPRPLNNRVLNVEQWLQMQDVVGDERRTHVLFALMFLTVCIANTMGLMLAKFSGTASVSGLRRALGARRSDIVRQHLAEVVLIGLAGGVAGVAVGYGGLWLMRHLLYLPLARSSGNLGIAESLTHLDGTVLAGTLGISILFGLLAGLYPAWRVGQQSPAAFLSKK